MRNVSYLWHESPCGLSYFGQNVDELGSPCMKDACFVARVCRPALSGITCSSAILASPQTGLQAISRPALGPALPLQMRCRVGFSRPPGTRPASLGSGLWRQIPRNEYGHEFRRVARRQVELAHFFERPRGHARFFAHLPGRTRFIRFVTVTRSRRKLKQIRSGRVPVLPHEQQIPFSVNRQHHHRAGVLNDLVRRSRGRPVFSGGPGGF